MLKDTPQTNYLFRGKTLTGEWVYGDLLTASGDIRIYDHETDSLPPVIPETVGQWTGWKDKSKTNIFTGDLVDSKQSKILSFPLIVCYHKEMGAYVLKKSLHSHEFIQMCEISSPGNLEIIGNITDNPNL